MSWRPVIALPTSSPIFVRCSLKIQTSEAPSTSTASSVSVLAILRHDLQKNGVEVQAHLDDQLPAVEGNKVQLQQVILNLLMNAIEAMQATQPRILKVTSERRKPELVHVSISDTGTGIDPANVDRVFGALFTTKANVGWEWDFPSATRLSKITTAGFG